jgi:glycerophosphoryl diester phosphodiesterase
VHGSPQAGEVTDPDYRPYVTAEMVRHAHRNGIKVVPWTVDDLPTMRKLVADGVDGIISDYPDRLRRVAAENHFRLPRAYASRDPRRCAGGQPRPRGQRRALRRHRAGPARRSRVPLRGTLIHDLTFAQVRTIDCGSKTLPEFPNQQAVPGEKIPTLREVLDVARTRPDLRLNIETKISPLVQDTADYRTFTRKLVTSLSGWEKRVTIQSFDWRTIRYARQLNPRISTVALVWQYGPAECQTLADECSLRASFSDPSLRSPWTGGLDWRRFHDLGALTRAAGASTVSANWQVHDPAQTAFVHPDWYLRTDPAYYFGPAVSVLQERYGLKVVPYTVDDEATMDRVIALGVDGLISDDPELLVTVARRAGLR